jgi:CRP-like cAMP-binding protein
MPQTSDCAGLTERERPIGLWEGSDAYTAFCRLIDGHRMERRAGAIIRLEGEGEDTGNGDGTVYFVLSGWLIASKSTLEGHRQIIDVMLPGDSLDPGAAGGDMSAIEVQALTDTTLAVIEGSDWTRLLLRHPEIGRAANRTGKAAIWRMSERMLRLGKGSAESIIAFTLCELCMRSTDHGLVAGRKFHIPMTQQQLGDLCGLSAVHVCRTLRRLERNGVISVTDHMDIVFHDLDALTEIAEIDPETLRQEIIPAA